MGARQISFINGEIYHTVLRSVEGILIFRDKSDYFRVISGLYEFNNKNPVNIWRSRQAKKQSFLKALQGRTLQSPEREKLVDVLAFCLMPNHIHLLLRQREDKGLTKFMRKLATGYAMYFNKKYQRSGHLFQGKFRAVHVKNDEQLQAVFVYIHANPVSLIFPQYKEKGVDDVRKAAKFLEEYKWSSYRDYIGIKNFPSVTQRDFLLKIMNGSDGCKEAIENWLKAKKELRDFETLTIE